MIEGHVCASIVQGRIQQLRGRVSTYERVDNQDCFDEKRDFHRAWDIDDAGVAVRILKGDVERARSGKGVLRDIDVPADVVVQVDLVDTGDFRGGAITPENLYFGSVGGTWCVGVSDDGEFVG